MGSSGASCPGRSLSGSGGGTGRGGRRDHPVPVEGRREKPPYRESRVGKKSSALPRGKKPFAVGREMWGRNHLLCVGVCVCVCVSHSRGGRGVSGRVHAWIFEGVAQTHLARKGRSHFLLTWGREKEDGNVKIRGSAVRRHSRQGSARTLVSLSAHGPPLLKLCQFLWHNF